MVESTDTSSFTKKDRDLIRMEFMDRFGSATSIYVTGSSATCHATDSASFCLRHEEIHHGRQRN